MNSIFQFELGQNLTDHITGFNGKVTARCEYINGEISYCLERAGQDGAVIKEWFDERRLK